jgi:hypothetical protein
VDIKNRHGSSHPRRRYASQRYGNDRANRAEKQLNPDFVIRRCEFDVQPDFLEEQLTALVTVVADRLSHDTVAGCARGGEIIVLFGDSCCVLRSAAHMTSTSSQGKTLRIAHCL